MRIRKMRIAACCLLITMWTGVTAQQTKPLRNQDVVAMVKAGLDDPTILMAIQANQEQFDLSVPGLIELKSANVSETIIRAMADKRGSKNAANAPTSAPSTGNVPATAVPAANRMRGPAVFRPFPIDFSAESFAKIGANAPTVSDGKMFVGGGRLRLESAQQNSATIVDPLKPAGYLLVPGKPAEVKTVFQGVRGSPALVPGLSKYLLPADPKNACENWETVECIEMGTETIDGRATTKWDLTHRFQDATWHSYIWVDVRLHVVSKREFMENVFQLRNIVEGPQAASLFMVP